MERKGALPDRRAARIFRGVTLINVCFFLILVWIVVTEYDTFLFAKTSFYSLTAEDWDKAVEPKVSAGLLTFMTAAGGLTKISNLLGCAYLLFGNQRRPVLPVGWKAAVLLVLAASAIFFLFAFLIRVRFAGTFPRAWMVLADDVFMPLVFSSLLLYGLHKRRQAGDE